MHTWGEVFPERPAPDGPALLHHSVWAGSGAAQARVARRSELAREITYNDKRALNERGVWSFFARQTSLYTNKVLSFADLSYCHERLPAVHPLHPIRCEQKTLADFAGQGHSGGSTPPSQMRLQPRRSRASSTFGSNTRNPGLVVLGFPCNQFRTAGAWQEGRYPSFASWNFGVSFRCSRRSRQWQLDAHPCSCS